MDRRRWRKEGRKDDAFLRILIPSALSLESDKTWLDDLTMICHRPLSCRTISSSSSSSRSRRRSNHGVTCCPMNSNLFLWNICHPPLHSFSLNWMTDLSGFAMSHYWHDFTERWSCCRHTGWHSPLATWYGGRRRRGGLKVFCAMTDSTPDSGIIFIILGSSPQFANKDD